MTPGIKLGIVVIVLILLSFAVLAGPVYAAWALGYSLLQALFFVALLRWWPR